MPAISAEGPDNEHMSVAALRSLLADDLAWFEQAIGHRISVEPLGKLKSVAALGRLHQHLECFPEPRFVQTAQACWTTWNRGALK